MNVFWMNVPVAKAPPNNLDPAQVVSAATPLVTFQPSLSKFLTVQSASKKLHMAHWLGMLLSQTTHPAGHFLVVTMKFLKPHDSDAASLLRVLVNKN